ncbi:hypothetical protein EYF80_065459 [Liparis tanakae]|uniref:Uncharacterized protein n=1 Tax=Liparis tanakae TaxID=230148 RepID=A0A4Z2E668_9TELE|nr:hypothetical protein EYF80_065459 [Liparis tanakae]
MESDLRDLRDLWDMWHGAQAVGVGAPSIELSEQRCTCSCWFTTQCWISPVGPTPCRPASEPSVFSLNEMTPPGCLKLDEHGGETFLSCSRASRRQQLFDSGEQKKFK